MEAKQKKRQFLELRNIILKNLSTGQKTLNQIASETGINWKTVDNHITFLIGKGFAKEIFSSRYVRIVEITEKGNEHLGSIRKSSHDDNSPKFEQKGEVEKHHMKK